MARAGVREARAAARLLMSGRIRQISLALAALFLTIPLSAAPHLAGSIALGQPSAIDAHTYSIPIVITTDAASLNPQALSFRIDFSAPVTSAHVARGAFTDRQPTVFEWQTATPTTASYIVVYDQRVVRVPSGTSVEIATLIVSTDAKIDAAFDESSMTMISAEDGNTSATVAKGTLVTRGATIDPYAPLKHRAAMP